MPVTGPDFVSLHVRDLEGSAAFYERFLGLTRAPSSPPHAVVFATTPIAFAVREQVGVDLEADGDPGRGIAVWLHATDVRAIHDALVEAGTTIASGPVDGPFGLTFAFVDPDGYLITLHDRG